MNDKTRAGLVLYGLKAEGLKGFADIPAMAITETFLAEGLVT
ncbi:MAG TPA: hypothetical protein VN611_11845 [Patescibacteria group bacterium]|nr:hypothetical protein [Patescibacteria group bacterium]